MATYYDRSYHKEHLFIVCELLRDNLYEFSRYNREARCEPYFTLPRLRRIATQCLDALRFVHGLDLIHCDLKPENILIKSYSRCEIKVIDFGSSCFTRDHLSSYVQVFTPHRRTAAPPHRRTAAPLHRCTAAPLRHPSLRAQLLASRG